MTTTAARVLRAWLVGSRRGTVVATVSALLAVGLGVGAWALTAPAGTQGHDVSYPQCGTSLPSGGTFGIVGVNGGKVSIANPCLASQYAWATARPRGAAVYVNTGNPGAISTFYWPASGARDPALCTDRTSSADPGCAYDYGWHGAANSLQIATSSVGSGVTAREWWLDVELANSWNGTTSANAAALQGAIDRLRSAGVASVGVYSTSYQWGQITGGYRSANAATYRSGWARAFVPQYPMENAPLWIAGLSTVSAAQSSCATSFTGAPAALAQYTDGSFDGDLVCGAAPTSPTDPTTPTSPTTTSPSGTTTTTSPPGTTTTTSPPGTTTTTSPPGTTTTTSPPGTTTTTSLPGTTTTTSPSPTTTTPTTTTPTTTSPPVALGSVRQLVAATHPVRGVMLTWAVPATTGGSTVTRYAILRGTAPGRETLLGVLTCTTPTCAWQDTAVVGGRLAYYQVIAINTANQVGPRSPEVSARGR